MATDAELAAAIDRLQFFFDCAASHYCENDDDDPEWKQVIHDALLVTGSVRPRTVEIDGEGSSRVETSPHHMLHRLWSACVDKHGYDKTVWREIERQLKAAGIVR